MILSFFKWPPKRFADNPRRVGVVAASLLTPQHTWECNGLKECQTLQASASLKAILGCCKANFSLF